MMNAKVYRMVTDDHICPFGLKAKDLLKRRGFTVDDRHLTSRAETDAFQEEHGVETTPQVFIDGKRIGGYDSLREHFDLKSEESEGVSYQPVVAVFCVTLLMALAATWVSTGELFEVRALEWFIAFSMCVLAILKLQDLVRFSNQFITYDLLARRVVRYAYVYPFAEAFAGLGMIAGVLTPVVAATALFIGSIGAVSVVKAVYIDRRELKCACVGGGSNVPLGFISLTENLMMVGMALWMFAQ
tara:strand:+ start:38193 stop:38921 length:729 start_codon:yes stop_codon:yes gene_type:complete